MTTLKIPVTRRPNDLARQLTGRPYISWSQVSTMRACPRKFFLRYIEPARPDFVPSSLKFGAAIHAALETHFCGMLEGTELSLPELHHAFRIAWREPNEDEAPIKFCKNEDEASLDDLAGRMLHAFSVSPLARPAGQIIAVEETIQAALAEDLPDLLARVDLVRQDEAGLCLTDFKTSRSRWNEAKAAQSAEQLILYRHVAQGLGDGQPIDLSFAVLTKAKSPAVQEMKVSTGLHNGDQVIESVRQVWSAAAAGNFYPNPSPMNCVTCPFRSKCTSLAVAVAGYGQFRCNFPALYIVNCGQYEFDRVSSK